ncbi:MAG: MipA/OmpV family protein [Lacisediminimonas sp.]|nr:MipA/OmpV family protein [Lacisediminimonas sp.]
MNSTLITLPASILRLACSLPLLVATAASAASLPLWEAGAGVAVLSYPDYRGADERERRILPLPYFIYRGERLKADRDGIRTTLFDSERIELNISANGSLPVSSRDNGARRGMPDLRTTLELGPTINIHLTPPHQRSTLELRLPVRAAMALSSPVRHVGWVFTPNLAWRVRDLSGMPGWNMSLSGGPNFQDRRYNSTFYSVAAPEVLPGRAAYSARGGYSGSQVSFGLSKRFPNYWVGAFMRYDYLGGAVFEDSSLMRSRNALSGGVAISWVFGQSSTMVQADQ